MSENKHTPGPWFAIGYAGFWNLQSDRHYSETDNLLDEEKNEQAPQNCQLASAAPDMLKAIKGLFLHVSTQRMVFMTGSDEWCAKDAWQKAQSAIEKAEREIE